MKKRDRFLAILILVLVACGSGCKKDAAAQGAPQTLEQGLEQLRTSLAEASPEVVSNLYNGVSNGIRYGNYPEALQAMDRIIADPGLNAKQKKIANDLTELLKKAAQDAQNAPAPAPAQ